MSWGSVSTRGSGTAAPTALPGVARLLEIQDPGHEHRGGAMGGPGPGAGGQVPDRGGGKKSSPGRTAPTPRAPAGRGGEGVAGPARPRSPLAPPGCSGERYRENKGDLREGEASPAAALRCAKRRRRRRRKKKREGGGWGGGDPVQLCPATATCTISLSRPGSFKHS